MLQVPKKLKLKIAAMARDGRLWLHINGVPYYYEIDAAYLVEVDRLVGVGAFGKALALVKRVATYYRKEG